MPLYIYGFLMSMVLAYLVTPFVMKLAWKVGAIDIPGDARRVHKNQCLGLEALPYILRCGRINNSTV